MLFSVPLLSFLTHAVDGELVLGWGIPFFSECQGRQCNLVWFSHVPFS